MTAIMFGWFAIGFAVGGLFVSAIVIEAFAQRGIK